MKNITFHLLKAAIIACTALPVTVSAQARKEAPTVRIATDKDVYFPGDSLHWQCALSGFGQNFNTVTLQIWVEQLRGGARWQYRFPLINGYTEGAMRIGDNLPAGRYAFNFLLQADFFNIRGQVRRPAARDTGLDYFILFKDRETMVQQARMDPDGRFGIRGLVYQDTAMFSFSRPGKRREQPTITIATSLDSSFTPVVPAVTKFIAIAGTGKDSNLAADIQRSKDYHFDIRDNINRQQLKEVVIKDRRSNKLLKDYEAAYVTPQFQTADDITLDGLTNDDMQQSGDIYNYLMMHVPGLTATTNPETGTQEVKWRNATPAIYVDEFRLPEEMPLTVMPGEIAMIKVYRPGSGPLTGGANNGGAIAIYTKVGPYSRFLPSTGQSNRFYIHGYDGLSLEWK